MYEASLLHPEVCKWMEAETPFPFSGTYESGTLVVIDKRSAVAPARVGGVDLPNGGDAMDVRLLRCELRRSEVAMKRRVALDLTDLDPAQTKVTVGEKTMQITNLEKLARVMQKDYVFVGREIPNLVKWRRHSKDIGRMTRRIFEGYVEKGELVLDTREIDRQQEEFLSRTCETPVVVRSMARVVGYRWCGVNYTHGEFFDYLCYLYADVIVKRKEFHEVQALYLIGKSLNIPLLSAAIRAVSCVQSDPMATVERLMVYYTLERMAATSGMPVQTLIPAGLVFALLLMCRGDNDKSVLPWDYLRGPSLVVEGSSGVAHAYSCMCGVCLSEC